MFVYLKIEVFCYIPEYRNWILALFTACHNFEISAQNLYIL